MSNNEKNNLYLKGRVYFTVICLSILFYYFMYHLNEVWEGFNNLISIIMPIIDGFVIAYLLSPFINFLENLIYKHSKNEYSEKGKKRVRVITIVFTNIFFMFIIYKFFEIIIPDIAKSITNIVDNADTYFDNFEKWINDIGKKNPSLRKQVNYIYEQYGTKIREWSTTSLFPAAQKWVLVITNGVFTALKAIWNLIIGFIISIYLLYNKETFSAQAKKIAYALMKRERANAFIHNARFTNKTFLGFFIGKIIDSIIIGFLCYFALLIFNIPYPVLVSMIVGVTNIIPFFGPFIGAIPCSLLILIIDPIKCLYFIILIIVIQQLDGNVIGPKILGNKTGLTSFWVIFAITLFGGLWGFMGMIVGVPIFAVLFAACTAYFNSKLEGKNLETETEKYKNFDYIDKDHNYVKIPKETISGVTSTKKESKKESHNPFDKILDIFNGNDDDDENNKSNQTDDVEKKDKDDKDESNKS